MKVTIAKTQNNKFWTEVSSVPDYKDSMVEDSLEALAEQLGADSIAVSEKFRLSKVFRSPNGTSLKLYCFGSIRYDRGQMKKKEFTESCSASNWKIELTEKYGQICAPPVAYSEVIDAFKKAGIDIGIKTAQPVNVILSEDKGQYFPGTETGMM